jgi:CRP/FNR family cyclic AMP-dependent transcriptional regulator
MDGAHSTKLRTRLLLDDIAGPAERERLLAGARTVHYAPRELIFREGDESLELFAILEGRVEFFLPRNDGQNIYLDEQEAGEYFGELALLSESKRRSASAVARVKTTCRVVTHEHFDRWLLEHPGCCVALLRHAAKRTQDLSDDLRASMSSAYERVVRFLEHLAVHRPDSEVRVIAAMPSHTQLARMLEISRERTSQILNELARGGYVQAHGRILLLKRDLPASY